MTRKRARKPGHPARIDDPGKMEGIARAAGLYLNGWAVWEIAEQLGVCEKTVRRYLADANGIYKRQAEEAVTAALATALEKRRVFARNLAEVREALSFRLPEGEDKGKLLIDERRAKEIVNTIRAEMANQERVEKLTAAEPAPAQQGGAPGVMGRSVRVRGAHGVLYEYHIGPDGKVDSEKVVEISGKVVVEDDDDSGEAPDGNEAG